MIGLSQYNLDQQMLPGPSAAAVQQGAKADRSAVRTDFGLLASALFLQRFSIPYGNTFVPLELVGIGLILARQFVVGRLLIQYDRLLWFLVLAFALTCSLWVNFKSTMLSGYLLFVTFFFLFTFSRRSTASQYRSTLQVFQVLVVVLSCLAVVQLVAEIFGANEQLTNFYGIFPDFLFGRAQVDRHEFNGELFHFRSNGIFLAEPSFLSQMTALGILIEVLEFRRPRYIVAMMLGFLLSYGGTGLMLLGTFLPLAGLRHSRAGLAALLVVVFALGLVVTGMVDVSAFSSRIGEFEDARASGFSRFVAPFWLLAEQFRTESAQELLLGHGPGTAKIIAAEAWYTGNFAAVWIKIFIEYGMVGMFILSCFLAACLRKSRCPGIVIAAIIFAWLFLQGLMTITIALCTLSGPGLRRARTDESRPTTLVLHGA